MQSFRHNAFHHVNPLRRALRRKEERKKHRKKRAGQVKRRSKQQETQQCAVNAERVTTRPAVPLERQISPFLID